MCTELVVLNYLFFLLTHGMLVIPAFSRGLYSFLTTIDSVMCWDPVSLVWCIKVCW